MENILDRSVQLGEFIPEPDDDRIVCRCEEVTKGEIRRAVHDGMFTITEIRSRHGIVSRSDLCKAGKANCCTGIASFSGSVRAGNLPCSDASFGDENICSRGKGGRVR